VVSLDNIVYIKAIDRVEILCFLDENKRISKKEPNLLGLEK
jgi:hypothetical protein